MKNLEKLNFLIIIFSFILALGLVMFAVKGQKGTPFHFQSDKDTSVGGPFESTNSTSRYALTEAIVENKTIFFNEERARFSAPDVVVTGKKAFSIFTPGISLLGLPFYILGKQFGLPQLFSYGVIAIFGVINIFLIAKLVTKIGGNTTLGFISGLVYLFSTNALSYSLTYTQHTVSTAVILLCLLNSFESKRTWINNLLFGFYFGFGILVDIPNGFMLLPVLVYILYKNIDITYIFSQIKVQLRLAVIFFLFGIFPSLTFLGWYNKTLTGSYMTLPQMIGRTDKYVAASAINNTSKKEEKHSTNFKLIETPFDTRLQLSGLQVLLFSNERSPFYYSPVIIFGLFGWVFTYRKKKYTKIVVISASIVLMNILIYSIFPDPWGGWAFGARYLIPSLAIICVGIGAGIQKWKKNPYLMAFFIILFLYSTYISLAGALTTNAIPPKEEAIHLQNPIPYTYMYNFQFIDKNQSSSLIYNIALKNFISVKQYLFIYTMLIFTVVGSLYIYELTRKEKDI